MFIFTTMYGSERWYPSISREYYTPAGDNTLLLWVADRGKKPRLQVARLNGTDSRGNIPTRRQLTALVARDKHDVVIRNIAGHHQVG